MTSDKESITVSKAELQELLDAVRDARKALKEGGDSS